ncbi:MAG: hypothetical protein IKN34_10665 [Treponema sp.]|nr:hypothetical protein [Treponema sp.]
MNAISKNSRVLKSAFTAISAISIISSLSIFSAGCSKEKQKNSESESSAPVIRQLPAKSNDHYWYAFKNDSFIQVESPKKAPYQSDSPWTECTRIADSDTGLDGNGYFLVNRLGALVFEKKDTPTLIEDRMFLSKSTISNLIFSEDTPYFTLSKNIRFNKSLDEFKESEDSEFMNRPYLMRIDTKSRLLLPCVTYADLGIERGKEISGSYFDGRNWISLIRLIDNSQIDEHMENSSVEYKKWHSNMSYASLSAAHTEDKLSVELTDSASYSSSYRPIVFENAPESLRNLLRYLPDSFGFSVVYRDAGGGSPKFFYRLGNGDSSDGSAISNGNWTCAVFEDGTTYFSGAIDGRGLINDGKTVAFRLPKLPINFLYTNFCISGDYLVIGWDESDEKEFFKIKRSGFLTVNMAKLFYSE